jgi:hypothetical protein
MSLAMVITSDGRVNRIVQAQKGFPTLAYFENDFK